MNCIRCGTKFDATSGRCPKCAWNPEETHGPLAGFLKGEVVNDRYTVRESLGQGRLGVVVKAIDFHSNRAVALKFIHPALIPDEAAGNRFLAGMERLKKEPCKGCAHVLDAGRAGRNRYYFARELLYGVTINQLMEDQQICGQTFPLDEAVLLIQKLARILSSVRGIAHGAFSPTKLWVLTDHIKIVDHGLVSCLPYPAVWHVLRRRKRANWYLAPELQDNRPPDSQSDVYSLAVLLGEMLSLAEYNGRVEIFRESEPDFPVEVEALLRCALSMDPDARYFDAQEFVTALFDVTGHQRTLTMPPDNTAVVPSKFLNTLRSMSEVPPGPQARDTQEDLHGPMGMELSDPLDDDSPDSDTDAEITRQVPIKDVLGDVEEQDAFDDLHTPSSPPLEDARSRPSRPAPLPPVSRSSVPSGPYPAAAPANRFAPPKPVSVSPSRPALAGQISARPAPPMPTPSRPAPPMPGPSTPGASEAANLSTPPPLPTSPPLSNPTPLVPAPFNAPPVPTPRQTSADLGSHRPPVPSVKPPVPSKAPPLPSMPPPIPSARPPVPQASHAPPSPSMQPPVPDKPPRTISALALEGINPRFLRAAAKIEEAKIRGETSQKHSLVDEEEWRRQLEESSAGSVISFLPPATSQGPNNEVQGFPKNQQNVPKPRIPSRSGGAKPPPIPTRKK